VFGVWGEEMQVEGWGVLDEIVREGEGLEFGERGQRLWYLLKSRFGVGVSGVGVWGLVSPVFTFRV